MHNFPDVQGTEFSNLLLKVGGSRFCAAAKCFPGAGGMQPLRDKLAQLQHVAKAVPLTPVHQAVPQQPMFHVSKSCARAGSSLDY
jgi:hypothetical protein